MQKKCKCGNEMNMRLRSVVYSSKVDIENVPVFSCDTCQWYEVFPTVKKDLSNLINNLGDSPQKQVLLFDEINEFAYLMFKVSDKEQLAVPVDEIIEERINQLLDLMLLAQSLENHDWMVDIELRLIQITEQALNMYDFS